MRTAASAADLLRLVAVGDKDEGAAAGHSCVSLQPCGQARDAGRQGRGCRWQAAGNGCLTCHPAYICTAGRPSGRDKLTSDRAVPGSSTYCHCMPCSEVLALQCRSQTEREGPPTVHASRRSTRHISVCLSKPLWTAPSGCITRHGSAVLFLDSMECPI